MPLSQAQRKTFKQQAHHLKPVVITGAAGLTEAVLAEIELALEHHELIKIRFGAGDRDDRKAMIDECCAATGAELVQKIGATATVYRKNPDKQ
ncbi:MAG: YhbY family RNA-binding protein [Oleiphilaceae bacterium]|nr:YhbY family RNA-binding protein [Oleiphilaceae bacterium]